ncbi:MAG: hypothetical protein HDS25_04960 [Bacteroides sp.]|nr:hypothetical protein [Bacteroides sp.]
MRKLLIIVSMLLLCLNILAQEADSGIRLETLECDSINLPVYLVDGIEVQNIDSILKDDIEKVEIVKDPAITKYFKPRLGGVVIISTKSKKNLKSVLLQYEIQVKKSRDNRIPSELMIR